MYKKRADTRKTREKNISRQLLASMADETVSIWRMLGFTDIEIRRVLNSALRKRRRRSKYPVRHESKVLAVANALGRWSTDADYCDVRGAPAKLRFDGATPSFASLVDSVCPGFDPLKAREMLVEGSAIHVERDGTISRTRDFLPVFGGTGAVDPHPVLVCLRSVINAQASVMTRDPSGLPTGGVFATCGAMLPKSKWDHFHWQARKIATSVFLLGEWIDANRVPEDKLLEYRAEDLVEPVVVLSIEFEGNSFKKRRTKLSRLARAAYTEKVADS